jgi:hypothetical protein
MLRYLLNVLFLSSFFFLPTSCSRFSYRYNGKIEAGRAPVQPVVVPGRSQHFKAKIRVFNKRYSGLMVVKQTAPSISHITMITEIGMKIFDFEMTDSAFRLTYIFEPLNKPRTRNLLQQDLKLMTLYPLLHRSSDDFKSSKAHVYILRDGIKQFYYTEEKNIIKGAWTRNTLFPAQKVKYFYDDSLRTEKITLRHKRFLRINIELNRINKIERTE